MFDGKEEAQAVAVPLFYGVVEAVAIGIYCVWAWKVGWTKAPPDEKLCVVVTKSYEIRHDDEDHAHGSDNENQDDNDLALAEGDFPSTPTSVFENEAIHAMESQPKQERAMGGRGFWVQMRRLFKDGNNSNNGDSVSTRQRDEINPVELSIDPSTGSVDAQFTTPPKSKDNRPRMTSDYTADTAGSSTPSPATSTERQFVYDSERTSL